VIYERALRMLGLPAEQVLAVGDSLEHDIAGAAGAGVDGVFVEGGIHAEELAAGALERLCRQHAVRPTFTLPFFRL
jgi:ribonucleotide monophosphatase NagD (HAD superfamily)